MDFLLSGGLLVREMTLFRTGNYGLHSGVSELTPLSSSFLHDSVRRLCIWQIGSRRHRCRQVGSGTPGGDRVAEEAPENEEEARENDEENDGM